MPAQLRKLAIIDTSDLDDTQLFSIYQEGASEASRQAISIEPNSATIENNREIYTSKVYDITLSGLYTSSAQSQLSSWSDGTNLFFSGYGLDNRILQAEGTLEWVRGFEDNASNVFSSQREAIGGYESNGKHSSGMSYCKNALALYDFVEGETSGIAAGWAKTGGTTSFSSGRQTFSTTGGSPVYLRREIHFPFPNKQLTFSLTCTSVTENDDVSISITEHLSTGFENTETNSSIGTGMETVSITTSDDVQYIIVEVEVNQNDSITFENPSLALGTNATYETFNT
jgi:hypothetical protein